MGRKGAAQELLFLEKGVTQAGLDNAVEAAQDGMAQEKVCCGKPLPRPLPSLCVSYSTQSEETRACVECKSPPHRPPLAPFRPSLVDEDSMASFSQVAAAKAERDSTAHARHVANSARHGYAPPGGGMDKATSFFGTQGIYPTRVPLEVTDLRKHLPLGYRYHVRSQVEAPPEIQADSKSIFVYQQTMPRAHELACAQRAAARPGYPYLRSYEWPAE